MSSEFSEGDLACGAVPCIHPEAVRAVRARMPESPVLSQLSEFYKLFGDSTRLRIIAALSFAELCVCDLSLLIDMRQPAVSQQLRILKQARIVKGRRQGKVIYYSLNDEHIRDVLQVGLEHMGETIDTAEADSICNKRA